MKPVIGVDISKGKSTIASFTDFKAPFKQVFDIEHNVNGFSSLLSLINDLRCTTGAFPVVVMEATGHYGNTLTKFLNDNNISLYIINPLISSRYRKSKIRSAKTDKIDSALLAEIYYMNPPELLYKPKDKYMAIRNISRQYSQFIEIQTTLKVSVRTLIDSVFPTYDKLYGNIYSNVSLETLRHFPHPSKVIKTSTLIIAKAIFRIYPLRGMSWCEKKAADLKERAKACYSSVEQDDALVDCLKLAIKELQHHINVVSSIRQSMIECARSFKEFNILTSIPGIGDILAAQFISEIGDIRKFNSHKQLNAFCGIEPTVYQSGKYNASNCRMTKRGNPNLRHILFLMVRSSLVGKIISPIKEYYLKKCSEGKPFKVSIGVCMNKLLRIIYTLIVREEEFRTTNL